MKRFLKCALKLAAVLLAAYVLTYAANSALGGYWLKPETDGQHRYKPEYGGLFMPTAIMWQPRFGHSTPFRGDAIGNFFSPLAAIDQAYWHPTHYLTDKDLSDWGNRLEPSQVHPQFRDEFRASQQAPKPSP